VWGAAASSYQIEGAAQAEGKGPSIWDVYCQQRGAIRHSDTGEVACDHFHRFREDVGLMQQMGLQAYRLSISWPRVIPEGEGAVNPKGLAFYDRLIDALLEAGIVPWVTLFHWDFPAALAQRGGWLAPQSPGWFAAYVRCVVERLSDRVAHWITINEPQVFLQYGLGDGTHAPGARLSIGDRLRAAHHVLLAHGLGVSAIREHARRAAKIGWAPVGITQVPYDPQDTDDVDAARRATLGVMPDSVWNNIWFNDPIVLGHYPQEGLAAYGADVPQFAHTDLERISQPIDFLGLNIYSANLIRATGGADLSAEQAAGWESGTVLAGGAKGEEWVQVRFPPGHPRTAFDWPVVEQALYWGPRYFYERYRRPMVITENGMAGIDWVALDGRVHDPQRIDFTTRYLGELARAMAEGVAVEGYFHWSLLDNFEWGEGFGRRFGLVHVDFPTGTRTIKDSGHWYRQVIATRGANLNATNK
jgi:beta-glucosidase